MCDVVFSGFGMLARIAVKAGHEGLSVGECVVTVKFGAGLSFRALLLHGLYIVEDASRTSTTHIFAEIKERVASPLSYEAPNLLVSEMYNLIHPLG
jgi:hypothetical protein